MSTTIAANESKSGISATTRLDWKLEVVTIPVSDIERAKRFYAGLGWRLDADIIKGEDFRIVQFTPPGSTCSVHFGRGDLGSGSGPLQNLYLVVSDIVAARADLLERGVAVSPIFHGVPGEVHVNGVDPTRGTYRSYATFNDPDGNGWLLQEITARLPGRVASNDVVYSSTAELAKALRRAEVALARFEEHSRRPGGDHADWSAEYMMREQIGQALPT